MFGIEKRKQKREEEKRRKEAEEKEKTRKGISWLLIITCGILTIATIPSFSMILFAAVTVMMIPIKQIDELWNKLLKGKPQWIRAVILGFVFVIACMISPLSDDTDKISNTEQIEISSEEVTETEPETETESETETETQTQTEEVIKDSESNVGTITANNNVSLDSIPAFSGSPYVAINDNVPYFTDSEMTTTAFENYSSLDSLGRCGIAYANICKDIMPTEERGEIGSVKPSGWRTVKYDVVSGKYLYNRCHLIGFQLAGENANTKNLITGTRYLNVDGMLPFENMVADYVKETGNHVLYRVTPMFSGNNLVASGVLMEAKSVEDNGAGILFNVYCYNNQPGITIDYATGDSSLDGTSGSQTVSPQSDAGSSAGGSTGDSNSTITDSSTNGAVTVHITDSGKKYHNAGCRYLKDSDREVTLDEAKSLNLEPCGVCNPPQ